MDQSVEEIVRCKSCGSKNRIPESKNIENARCGKCESRLFTPEKDEADSQRLTLRCGECRTKNLVPVSKIDNGPKCGRCGILLQTRDILSNSPIMISDGNFEEMVLKSPLPVLMYSWAQWCTGCKTVTPIIHDFAASTKGKIRVGKLNVESNPMLASRFKIMSIPFLHIFDGGQVQESLPGGLSKYDLMMKMAHYL